MELRKDAKYAMVIPTSMGIRITPINGQPVHSSDLFKMTATSAESNVGSTASYLGLPVKILTTFVKGSPIARMIKDNLASRHMDYEGPELEQDNPWGYRHQINIADSGVWFARTQGAERPCRGSGTYLECEGLSTWIGFLERKEHRLFTFPD